MTRDEASFILANIDRRVCDDELNDALDMAIKALEQEPCGDAISRSGAIEVMRCHWEEMLHPVNLRIQEDLKKLAPVQPKIKQEPKTGHWINTAEPYMSDNIVCSECGFNSIARYSYCPNCGTKMESEGKK